MILAMGRLTTVLIVMAALGQVVPPTHALNNGVGRLPCGLPVQLLIILTLIDIVQSYGL